MKRAVLASAILALAGLAFAADAPVKVQTLRGAAPLDQTVSTPEFKPEKKHAPTPRTFEEQPPLIPHPIEKYAITMKANDCFECHAGTRDGKADAVRPSNEHFKDREGKLQNALSPARYFCDQCHVPQTDAKPLIDNAFRSADAR